MIREGRTGFTKKLISAARGNLKLDEMERVRQGLLESCRMDPLGMVRLDEKLGELGC